MPVPLIVFAGVAEGLTELVAVGRAVDVGGTVLVFRFESVFGLAIYGPCVLLENIAAAFRAARASYSTAWRSKRGMTVG